MIDRLAVLVSLVMFPALLDAQSRLPWEQRGVGGEPERPSAAELLKLFGIGPAELGSLVDRRDWEAAERALLWRALFRLPQVKQVDVENWAARDWRIGRARQ